MKYNYFACQTNRGILVLEQSSEHFKGKGGGSPVEETTLSGIKETLKRAGATKEEVKEEMKRADMLVLASPIYFFSPSAQLEAAIQRMHAEGIPDNIRESAMILTSGSPGVYDAAKAQYKAIFDYLGTRDRGIFTACGSESRFERKQKELEDFGRSLVS